MESPDQDNDVTTTTPTTNHNNNNNNNHSKPGRKFGLVGQRTNSTPPNSPAVVDDPSRRMSVREDQKHSWMYSLSEQEMEDKFNAICLSIRTENLTLGQRLEHQLAERDLVEANLNQEMRGLHALFLVFTIPFVNHLNKGVFSLKKSNDVATTLFLTTPYMKERVIVDCIIVLILLLYTRFIQLSTKRNVVNKSMSS